MGGKLHGCLGARRSAATRHRPGMTYELVPVSDKSGMLCRVHEVAYLDIGVQCLDQGPWHHVLHARHEVRIG